MAEVHPYCVCIDDDRLSRQIMEMMLVSVMGYPRPVLWENTENILDRLASLDTIPTLIFLDINILPFDGYTVTQWLRAIPRYNSTKIIAITAGIKDNELIRLRRLGCDGLISKPISQSTFPELFSQILAGESVWDLR